MERERHQLAHRVGTIFMAVHVQAKFQITRISRVESAKTIECDEDVNKNKLKSNVPNWMFRTLFRPFHYRDPLIIITKKRIIQVGSVGVRLGVNG